MDAAWSPGVINTLLPESSLVPQQPKQHDPAGGKYICCVFILYCVFTYLDTYVPFFEDSEFYVLGGGRLAQPVPGQC